jgi:hypothetical protein
MLWRIINLPIWHHPKFGLAARIAVAAIVIELGRAFGDAYEGRAIGASLVSDVFTGVIPAAWLPIAIGLGILANRKTQSLLIGWLTAILAGIFLLAAGVQIDDALGVNAWY